MWLRTLSVRGGGGHSSSSAQQGHLATSSLLGLQLQHSKPPSWMYLFEKKIILKTRCCSLIKQNVLKIYKLLCAALHHMLCQQVLSDGRSECVCLRGGEGGAERLSWISWVTALPLLHAWPRIKKNKTLNRRHCIGEIYIHAYLHVFCTLQLIYSRELWAELWGVGLRERDCNSMYTMPLFHICSSVWMWLLCIKGCFTRVKLVGWGCGRF